MTVFATLVSDFSFKSFFSPSSAAVGFHSVENSRQSRGTIIENIELIIQQIPLQSPILSHAPNLRMNEQSEGTRPITTCAGTE